MGPGRSSSLRIGGDSSVVSDSGQASGASDRLAGCNTPKYTLVVFDMFRVFCRHNLNV